RRRRSSPRTASQDGLSRSTRPPYCSSSTIRIFCLRASLPATRRWAAVNRACSRRSANWASMPLHIISSSFCRSTVRSIVSTRRPRPRASTIGRRSSRSSRTGGSIPTSRPYRRGAWGSRSTAKPGCLSVMPISGTLTRTATTCDLATLPLLLGNAARGHYKVHLDPGFNGPDSELKFNSAYRLDPEIQKWFANLEFRRALALGIDREQINEAFFLGLGVTGTPIPADIIPESPGKDWRQRWATLDVAKANAMLDAI